MFIITALCLLCACAPAWSRVLEHDATDDAVTTRHRHDNAYEGSEEAVTSRLRHENIAELLLPLLERSLARGHRQHRGHKHSKVIQVLPYRSSAEHKRKGWRSHKKQVVEITPLHGKDHAAPLAYILSAAKPTLTDGDTDSSEEPPSDEELTTDSEEPPQDEDVTEADEPSIQNADTYSEEVTKESGDEDSVTEDASSDASKESGSENSDVKSSSQGSQSAEDKVSDENTDLLMTDDENTARSVAVNLREVTSEHDDVTVENSVTTELKDDTAETSEDITSELTEEAVTEVSFVTAESNDDLTNESTARTSELMVDVTTEGFVTVTSSDSSVLSDDVNSTEETDVTNELIDVTVELKDDVTVPAESVPNTESQDSVDLTPEVKDVTSEVTEVTTEATDVTSEVPHVTSEVTDVTSEVTDVTIEVAEVTSEIADVNYEVADVTSVVADVTPEVTDVTSEATDVNFEAEDITSEAEDAVSTDTTVGLNDDDLTKERITNTAGLSDLTSGDEDSVYITAEPTPKVKTTRRQKEPVKKTVKNVKLRQATLPKTTPTQEADAFVIPGSTYIEKDIIIASRPDSGEGTFNKMFDTRSRDIVELIEASSEPRDCSHSPSHDHKSYRLSFLFNK